MCSSDLDASTDASVDQTQGAGCALNDTYLFLEAFVGRLSFCLSMIFSEKSISTFRDHALFQTGSGDRDGGWQLREPLRRFGRAEILGFLIPGSRHCRIGWRIGPYR